MIAPNKSIEAIKLRIGQACLRAGRNPADVTLVAVAKTFPAEVVAEAVESGVADIGENYVQELLKKRDQLAEKAIRWHFIGHLQTNKVKYIAEWIHLIHAVDRKELVQEIDRRAERAGRIIDLLVEVNTTGEQSKFGLAPEMALPFIRTLAEYRNITVAGLMTIGPFLPDPEGSRPMFRRLKELREEAKELGQPNVSMRCLSMGMTGDFEVAIEEGATHVRIGTAIFGRRQKPAR
ncbi:YggS family pyridoxal phosphate-dependent enzyme [bacterium]|nr:MAG: YggS family pyridoxal phosphate-dependent enzyme [bacterium]